jgi:hypothetical protein
MIPENGSLTDDDSKHDDPKDGSADKLPAAPSKDDDCPLGSIDQHSSA